MTTRNPGRQTRFDNVPEAHAAFFGDDHDVTVEQLNRVVDITKTTTIVESRLMLNIDGDIEIYRARGEAKRLKGDPYDANVGIRLATSRALDNLARKLERQAQGQMNHNEAMAADSQARKDANKERSVRGRQRAIEAAAEDQFEDDESVEGIAEHVKAAVTSGIDGGRLGAIFGRG